MISITNATKRFGFCRRNKHPSRIHWDKSKIYLAKSVKNRFAGSSKFLDKNGRWILPLFMKGSRETSLQGSPSLDATKLSDRRLDLLIRFTLHSARFEDRLGSTTAGQDIKLLDAPISCMLYSPNGKWLAAARLVFCSSDIEVPILNWVSVIQHTKWLGYHWSQGVFHVIRSQ